ncbi:MAG: TrkH family potassium uptake protein [Rubellimicrobium sp.]|nr:TrkH family potassium uptake protein [Rubellimicrobium sp.]
MMRLLRLPLVTLAMAGGTALMLVPSFHALARGDHATARGFFYGAVLGAFLTLLVALATRGRGATGTAREQLVALFVAYGLLPVLLALPFAALAPGATPLRAWFEMVSSITTTGATLWDRASDLNLSLHLWRGLVGWYGGFIAWVAAIAILAPLNLGGYEMRTRITLPPVAQADTVRPAELLARATGRLAPVYAGLTAVLWLGLVLGGDDATTGAIHAMGVISTSGITPLAYADYAASGFAGELAVFVFFVFALSRATFARPRPAQARWHDTELRLGLRIILVIAGIMLLRALWLIHRHDGGLTEGLHAAWGILFTTASFLTTTGVESRWWPAIWANAHVPVPGLVLVALALVGGGVGTAAGGVKLLRIHEVLTHAGRGTLHLIEPASVARAATGRGAVMGWTFFTLFALSVLIVMGMLSLAPGMQFEGVILVSLAAITSTGQLVLVAADTPISFDGLTPAAQVVAALAMILGRLEVLALIALFNPDFWRR